MVYLFTPIDFLIICPLSMKMGNCFKLNFKSSIGTDNGLAGEKLVAVIYVVL